MTPDERILRVLNSQQGLIRPDQAMQAGMTRPTFEHRVRTGRLLRVCKNVYRAPTAPRTFEQRVLAACLATDGFASYVSAGALFRLVPAEDAIHVTIPIDRRRTLD